MAVIPSSERERYLRELAGSSRSRASAATRRTAATCARAAEWVAAQLAFAAAASSRPAATRSCSREWLGAPDAPTILVYGHYDVQPPGDEAEWQTPPFEPSVRDGRIYARGATDDKGPVFVALKVAEAFHTQQGRLPLNVRFLIEGEEEIGSPSLARVPGGAPRRARGRPRGLGRRRDVAADGAVGRDRGQGAARVRPRRHRAGADLHSGRHGGAVQNPNHALARDRRRPAHARRRRRGRGLLRRRRASSRAADRDALGRVPFDEEAYRRRGRRARRCTASPATSTLERLWTRPTLEVNGIRGGGAFTVIPRRAPAHITCRLVPGPAPGGDPRGDRPHIEAHVPAGRRGERRGGSRRRTGLRIAADHPAVRPPLRRSGRSTPTTSRCSCASAGRSPRRCCSSRFSVSKTLLFSFSIADENLHAPNEFFRLQRLEEGMRAWAELWMRLAQGLPTRLNPAAPAAPRR